MLALPVIRDTLTAPPARMPLSIQPADCILGETIAMIDRKQEGEST